AERPRRLRLLRHPGVEAVKPQTEIHRQALAQTPRVLRERAAFGELLQVRGERVVVHLDLNRDALTEDELIVAVVAVRLVGSRELEHPCRPDLDLVTSKD